MIKNRFYSYIKRVYNLEEYSESCFNGEEKTEEEKLEDNINNYNEKKNENNEKNENFNTKIVEEDDLFNDFNTNLSELYKNCSFSDSNKMEDQKNNLSFQKISFEKATDKSIQRNKLKLIQDFSFDSNYNNQLSNHFSNMSFDISPHQDSSGKKRNNIHFFSDNYKIMNPDIFLNLGEEKITNHIEKPKKCNKKEINYTLQQNNCCLNENSNNNTKVSFNMKNFEMKFQIKKKRFYNGFNLNFNDN